MKRRGWRAGITLFTIAVSFLFLLLPSRNCIAPPPGWETRALDYADQQRMFGPMTASVSGYVGSFVRFDFDALTARVQGYTIQTPARSTQFFLDVTSSPTATGTYGINGSKFEYSSLAMEMTVHNNPTAALMVDATGIQLTVNFTLSAGINARRFDSMALNLSTSDLKARLFVTGAGTIALVGNLATVLLPQGSKVVFRMSSVAGEGVAGAAGQDTLADAAVRNLLLLESFQIQTEGFVLSSNSAYNGMAHVNTNFSANGFNVTLHVAGSSGVATLYIHTSVFYPANGTQYTVRIDNSEVEPLSTIEEVVNNSGSGPAYVAMSGINGILFVVYLPSPLNHVFNAQLVSPPPGEEPLNLIFVASILAVVVVALIAATAYMLRRKGPKKRSD